MDFLADCTILKDRIKTINNIRLKNKKKKRKKREKSRGNMRHPLRRIKIILVLLRGGKELIRIDNE